MKKKQEIFDFLKSFCDDNNISLSRLEQQFCAISDNIAVFCVSNPNSPKADGLSNDIDTLMLPTLFVHINKTGMTIETTEYTSKYLIYGN